MEHDRREPAPGVFRLVLPLPFEGLPRVNAYLLDDDAGATLVDCGIYQPTEPDHGWDEFLAALKACDRSPSDVARLVITHPHVDHYGMAGRVVEETGCELWLHEDADEDLDIYRDPERTRARLRQMLSDHGVSRNELDELSAFEDWRPFISGLPDVTTKVKGGEALDAGGQKWTVVHTPGHAASHICLWQSDRRILISGDHLLPAITPHIDFRRGERDPLGAFLDSLDKVAELEPDLVLPGHGRPFEDGAERARGVIRHHDRRLGSILQVIRREPRSASEITDEIFGGTLLNFERRLALGEALAHLAHLRSSGEIERFKADDGTLLYKKVSRRRRAEAEEE